MEKYRNSSGNSGVYGYEIGIDYIRVKFAGTSKIYTYSYRKAGTDHVEKMKIVVSQLNYVNCSKLFQR